MKRKSNPSPWITKGIPKSSNRKQRLYKSVWKIELQKAEHGIEDIKIYLKQLKENLRNITSQNNHEIWSNNIDLTIIWSNNIEIIT